MDQYFPTITIADFTERADSSYSLAGEKFNLVPPSIQNPVAFSSSASGTIGGSVVVATTAYFADEGYLLHDSFGSLSIIKYTGKTATQFTGCTVESGSTSIENNATIIPYQIN